MRMIIRNANVEASENVVHPVPGIPKIDAPPLMIFSHIPMMNPPMTAPGMLPIPPNTAATNALSPGMLPLVGVTVLVKGTSVGTTTQGDGRYELEIPAGGEVLQFSFLGMDTQEAAIGSRTAIDVSLASSTTGIDEVVVVGYGTLTKRELSSSVGSLRSDDLDNRTSAFNIMQDMAGKIAGVKNVSFSGKPGGASALRIRGMGSINAGSDPIYVLDGGRVAEQGSPAELLARGGLFARMVRLQTESAEWAI